MYKKEALLAVCAIGLFFVSSGRAVSADGRPNIIFIMCDDLGYGDVSACNPDGKIPTPHMDRIADEGMMFTDAHSGSSVCTPTRYGVLTGRYSWRTKLQKGVVQGFAPCLIAKDRPTVAGFLREQGYHTGIVGKWHLDFQYTDAATGEVLKKGKGKGSLAPVGSKIPDGPVHRGFDYYHGFHHARDMEGIIENDTVIAHDDVINMLPRIQEKAVEYIAARAKDRKPFFLYVPFGSPHTPIVPTPAWQGKSKLGPYADFVMETDAAVGAITAALDKHGFTENTLLVFTSDNGCSKAAGIKQLAEQGHAVSGPYRGSKADLWDGGHRVPFFVRWPEKIKAHSVCEQPICHVDFFATVAAAIGEDLPAHAAEDSVSYLAALSGEPISGTRAGIIHHSISGHFAYRQGKWKLLLARASGGWSAPKENSVAKNAPVAQLYDMEADPAETTDLYQSHPEVAARLLKQLDADVFGGRSTTGTASENDIEGIVLWKSGSSVAAAEEVRKKQTNAKTRTSKKDKNRKSKGN